MQLYEKYRPSKLAGIVGQAEACRTVRTVMNRPNFDREAFWIEGLPGTGKTSIALAIANELGCPAGSFLHLKLDGEACKIEEVRALQESAECGSLFSAQWRVVIVNEAHAMTPKAVQAWLTFLEALPAHWLIVFTTSRRLDNLFGDEACPFAGRVKIIRLTKIGLASAFAKHLKECARLENLDGRPLSAYEALVVKNHLDLRLCFQHVEMGCMVRPSRLTAPQQRAVRNLVRRARRHALARRRKAS